MRARALLLFALLAPALRAAPLARVVRTNPVIDLVDVASQSDAPVGNAGFQTDSLAMSPSGSLFSANPSGNLFNVTGPVPIPVGATGYAAVGDLDYAPGGLWGFGNAGQTLFFYSFASNAVTYAQAMPALAPYTVTGVAYRPSDGSVFLSGKTGLNLDRLFVVPPSATAPTLVGAITISDALSYVADIDFAPNGALVAMSWYHRDFYTVSTTTAATSLISAGPHRDVTGMALPPVPEPASLLALAGGAACLLLRPRRA